jgi:hypothetical protein
MRLILFTTLMLMTLPILAGEQKISNCGKSAIEAEWRELIDQMGEISGAERRDAIAVNKKRLALCQQVDSGDLTLDEGIAEFEAERERWKERTRTRKRINASEFVAG